MLLSVLRIRIRIHRFLGLLDPDPLVRGMDPAPDPDLDPSIIMQKEKSRFLLFCDSFFFLSLKNSKKM
jgi:hypothetical protein